MSRVHAGVQRVLEHEQVTVVRLHAEMALTLTVDPDLRAAFEQSADEVAELAAIQLEHDAAGGDSAVGGEVGAHVARSADEVVADDVAPAEPDRLAQDP